MVSSTQRTVGRVLSGLVVLFLCFSGGIKLVNPPPVAESFEHLGIPYDHRLGLAALELLCTLLYAIPRTAVRGAILLTGYLGGAIVAHLRVGDPWATHTLFPIWIGALAWGGLALRSRAVRDLWLGRLAA